MKVVNNLTSIGCFAICAIHWYLLQSGVEVNKLSAERIHSFLLVAWKYYLMGDQF